MAVQRREGKPSRLHESADARNLADLLPGPACLVGRWPVRLVLSRGHASAHAVLVDRAIDDHRLDDSAEHRQTAGRIQRAGGQFGDPAARWRLRDQEGKAFAKAGQRLDRLNLGFYVKW